jgi:peroxiredoxin
MATGNRHGMYWVTAAALALVLALGVGQGCRRVKPEGTAGTSPGEASAVPTATKEVARSSIETAANLFREPRVSIQNIVKAANDRWTPAFQEWWEKPAPDFTLTDIDGQTHRLGDYRGRDVVVVFWTTWYATCKKEVQHWKELRSAYPKDKLAILAISSEPTALLKKAAEEQGVNYTLLTTSGNLPAPFDKIETVPSSFFIGADGRFKVAINGMVPATDSKAIVQAQ